MKRIISCWGESEAAGWRGRGFPLPSRPVWPAPPGVGEGPRRLLQRRVASVLRRRGELRNLFRNIPLLGSCKADSLTESSRVVLGLPLFPDGRQLSKSVSSLLRALIWFAQSSASPTAEKAPTPRGPAPLYPTQQGLLLRKGAEEHVGHERRSLGQLPKGGGASLPGNHFGLLQRGH